MTKASFSPKRSAAPNSVRATVKVSRGGKLLSWIDEEAAIFAMCQLGKDKHLVTKFMSEINFVSSAKQGDVIEMGVEVVSLGRSSITLCAKVRNKLNKATILY